MKDVTHAARVVSSEFGQGCVRDYNNDGFQDLVVGTFGRVLVYRNQGDGTFIEVADQSGISGQRWTSSVAGSDLDLDGDLDLYITTYVRDPLTVTCRDNDGRPTVCALPALTRKRISCLPATQTKRLMMSLNLRAFRLQTEKGWEWSSQIFPMMDGPISTSPMTVNKIFCFKIKRHPKAESCVFPNQV